MEKEVTDKAAKAAAEAEAARKAAELAANPPPPPAPPEPKPAKQRKTSAKGELEPWSAYSHRDLSVQPIVGAPPASSAASEGPTAEPSGVPPGQVEDVTQITPRYRYASVWQDESGQSRYSESQTPVHTTPAPKKSRKGKDRASSDSRTYAHPTSGYHYDSRYGWYDYSRGQWLQPHQYAQMHTLGASTSTPAAPGPTGEAGQAGSPSTPAAHPYYNDPYYQAYYRNYTQGQYADPRWAAYYAQYGDPSKSSDPSQKPYTYGDPYPPGGAPQPYPPYYGAQPPPADGAPPAITNSDGSKPSELTSGPVAQPAVEAQATTDGATSQKGVPEDDPMDGSHTVETTVADIETDEAMALVDGEA